MRQTSSVETKHRSGLSWIGVSRDAYIWSEGVFDILGLSPTEFAPSPELFMSFIHPDDGFVRDALTAPRDGAPDGERFFRIVRRDGAIRLASITRPAIAGDGKPDWLCLFDYSNQIDPLGEGLITRGGLSAAGSASPGFWGLYAVDGSFTLSQTAAKIFGVARGERITLAQLVRQVEPSQRERLAAMFTESRETPAPSQLMVEFRRVDDGRLRRLTLTLKAESDPGGNPLGLWGMVEDVSVAAERDEELRATRQMLDACLKQTADGIAVLDRDGSILSINDAGCALMGLEDARGRVLWELRPELIGDRLWHAFRDTAAKALTLQEERYVAPFGRWLRYSLSPIGDQVLLVFRSVDDVYRLKSLLSDMAERCGTAMRGSRSGIWEIDQESGNIWFSDSVRSFLGSSAMTIAEFRSRVPADDLAALDEALQIARIDRQCFQIDLGYRSDDGALLRLRARGSVVDEGPERRTRFAGLVRRLSEAEWRENGQAVGAGARGAAALTGSQVRAARGALRWSVRELAEQSDVSVATINRFEAGSKTVTARDSSVSALERVLIASGIEFFLQDDGRPAIAIGEEAEEISRGQIAA